MIRDATLESKKNRDADDTLLAGWMYADLFLGLMVVFLATVTFIPEYLGGLDSSARNSAFNYQEIYQKPMIVVYDDFDSNRISQDIQAFLIDERLSSNTTAIYTQIVGAYDKVTETQSAGILRAQDISQKLDNSGIKILQKSSTTLSVSNGIPINRFVLKITFATDVGVASTP